MEELLERATGPVGIGVLLLLAFPGGREAARVAVKTVVRAGLEVTDCLREIYKEVEEERQFYAKVR